MAEQTNTYTHPIVRTQRQLRVKTVRPGSLVEFSYASSTTRRKPIVLVITSGYWDKKVNTDKHIVLHGININYIPVGDMRKFKRKIESVPVLKTPLKFDQEIRDERGRFMITENRFTQLMLPVTKSADMERVRALIQTFYSKRIKMLTNKYDCYRMYKVNEISNIRGIIYKF